MKDRVNKGVDYRSSAWNYRGGRLIVLTSKKYLLMGSGSLSPDSDISKIGKIDKMGTEFFLWNNERKPALNPCL